jgi:hypothetical protein
LKPENLWLVTGNWWRVKKRPEIGDWRLETGDWRLETGDWRLETGKLKPET